MFAQYATSDQDARDAESSMDPRRPPTERERRAERMQRIQDAVRESLASDDPEYEIERAFQTARELEARRRSPQGIDEARGEDRMERDWETDQGCF